MSIYHPPVAEHENVVAAALHVVQATHYSRADDPHEYAIEQLALASRALAEAVERKPADEQPIGWTKSVDEEALKRAREQLLEAMGGVSEERTCASWCGDWARTLHAEGGIWETLGRAVGWPTGNYDQWVWVSWDEATTLYDGGGE